MSRKIGMSVSYYEQHSERIVVAKIDKQPTPSTAVKVYMPTSSAHDEEVEKMYDEVKDIIQFVKGDKNLIVTEDWNSILRKGREGKIVGEHVLGQRNDRGNWLVEFCTEHNLIIVNTWFKNPESRLYTWKRPEDTGRFQIDSSSAAAAVGKRAAPQQ